MSGADDLKKISKNLVEVASTGRLTMEMLTMICSRLEGIAFEMELHARAWAKLDPEAPAEMPGAGEPLAEHLCWLAGTFEEQAAEGGDFYLDADEVMGFAFFLRAMAECSEAKAPGPAPAFFVKSDDDKVVSLAGRTRCPPPPSNPGKGGPAA